MWSIANKHKFQILKLYRIFVIVKIRLIKKKTIVKFVVKNVNSKRPFDDWIDKLKNADWQSVNDIKQTFGTADQLGKSSNRIVFNIGGNNYRIICKYHFGKTNVHLFITWIGTHADYTKLCDKELQYTINLY